MTAITIRRLPPEVKQRLRMRAAEHGRSMEAEARDILVDALVPTDVVDLTWIDMLREAALRYDSENGVDLEIPEDSPVKPPDFRHLLDEAAE